MYTRIGQVNAEALFIRHTTVMCSVYIFNIATILCWSNRNLKNTAQEYIK